MKSLEDLLALPGQSLARVIDSTGAPVDERERITGYQGLRDVDVIEAPGGVRIHVRGNEVVLIYVDPAALPDGVTGESLAAAIGSEGEWLRSRQGKRAGLHVVADRGVAWSEVDGEIGFVELFPPTTNSDYEQRIYQAPPAFIQ